MRRITAFLRRVSGLWGKDAKDLEFSEEIAAHLRMRTEENIRAGMSPAEARRAAVIESGGIELAREAYRDRRGLPWLENILADFRYAFRTLRKQPVFTLIAALTLALGIGANTAIFSLVYSVLLRPLPYPGSDQLVFVWNAYRKGGGEPTRVAIPDYLDRRADAPAIEESALFTPRETTLFEGEQPESVVSLAVTPSFFSTLGRGPSIGRAFTPADAVAGHDHIVILTHAVWQSHFGADASVIGRDVPIGGVPYTVAGVLPADFELPWPKVSILVPFTFTAAQTSDAERGNEFSVMIARLRPGATITQLNAQMDAIVGRLIERLPDRAAYMRNSGFSGVAVGMRDQLVGDVRLWLWLLQAGVGIVLLIACANVANLLLMRATGRHRELAIRAALGAGGWRILQQLLAEGAALSFCGAAAGVVLAVFGVRGLVAMTAGQFPGLPAAGIHPAVLAFTAAVAVVTSFVFGLVPALPAIRSSAASSAIQEDTARGSATKRTGFARAALVIGETALAVVLLVAAGLLVRSFVRLARVNPGFATQHVLTARISLPAARYHDADSRRAFWQRALDQLRETPGVTASGLTSSVPFSGHPDSGSYALAGRPLEPGEKPPHARQDFVMGDYFHAMGIPLLQGRTFIDSTDTPQSPRVVVIDEFLANRQFPGRDPIGQQLSFGRKYTIVGVVGTINDSDLALPVPEEHIYFDAVQIPLEGMSLVVKTALAPAALVPAVRAAVRAVDAGQPVADVNSMDQWVATSLSGRRTPMTLLLLFGAVALLLSAIGMYGVLAYGVSQRVRELGIRQALGADRAAIVSLVLSQGMWTVGAGLVVGLGAAAVLTRYLHSMLFGVTARDPLVFGAVTLVLLAAAALACYVPARRATRVDPIAALRAF